ncbi:beta-galactosidase/beta-glucuronidase [Wenyingzhuangia heitensis]|uniref:Beta-galactosidase/beta-glucuronidase n=1 Tax=Wenyingzhuangia heitensis TaxID=1487859 RepID=A0ABX0UAT3_9FLAO|nr:glycoside hydrolase family 2 TIM barrel-domain containing protein [Wenyingzhuangia heitensis]NIJ45928.1 beta-galactosidase/beta-glucuronidase [Wenyingzhuangia heitensis]
MRKFLSLLFITCLFGSCANNKTYEVYNSYQKTISLNGVWQFLASNNLDEANVVQDSFAEWDTLRVPGNWDTKERYATYVGKGYYQKNFTLPKNWENKQIRLKFGAVYQTAKVWLNGELLGKNVGGYLPFEFNITNKINKDGENSLVVMADNTIRRGAWWAWGGISREVSLLADEELRMVNQHISSVPDFENNKVSFTIKYKIENKGSSAATVNIKSNIKDGEKMAVQTISVPANSTQEKIVKFQKDLSDYKLWDFNNPNLYKLQSELVVNGNVQDVVADNFGIRKFEVKGEQFFLNNNAVRMNGVNRVHDHPDYGNTEPDHLILKDMKDIKSLGANFSRLMHAPLSKNILDFCDKNGMLLVEEIPVWGAEDPNSRPNNSITKQWMKRLIERDFNHPSVVAWSVGNELRTDQPKWGKQHLTKGQYTYVNEMIDYTTSLDTTRLKTYVSNTSYQGGEVGKEPYEKVDFLSVNSYGNALKIVEKVHDRFPNKPIFISEIGKGQIGPVPDAVLKDELVEYIYKLKDYPYVTGVSIWSYNDYRSDYKGTPESGFREWGIVSETREQKKAYKQLKDAYQYWLEK